MMSVQPNDYWTQPAAARRPEQDFRLRVEFVDEITPLDRQFGVNSPRAVPDPLIGPLFGQPDPDRPLYTDMILDAARVQALPELLEASGLEYRCLFKGDAYEDLKDVAPWVVRLDAESRFTRNLFTRSDTPWHLWELEPGIYLRSRETLEDIWRHFRKFTKLRDDKGKWYYWRFWEGGFLLQTLNAATAAERRMFFHDGKIVSTHTLTAGRHPRLTTLKPPL